MPARNAAAASLATLIALLASGCGSSDRGAAPVATPVQLRVDGSTPIAHVSERFLSFAVDTAEALGGVFWDPAGSGEEVPVPVYDFGRPRLRRLVSELSPAMLRIGGTAADYVFYDLGAVPVASPPPPYRLVLTRTIWEGIASFARDLDLEILFTLDAGPGARDALLAWNPTNARDFVSYVAARGDPVTVWELGNEINGYPIEHFIRVDGRQYARDVAAARALVDELHPAAQLAGPSSAYWPPIGEAFPVMPQFLAAGGSLVDVVTWHFYPQQSKRCPIATRRASPTRMLDPDNLAAVDRWAERVEAEVREHAPNAQVWLGETGNAQCGGEPGVSDRFVGSLWWLDELGRMARRGQPVVVRQTLSGSDYGLIDDATLEPNPDYWASLLWRRLMGTRVLSVDVSAGEPSEELAPPAVVAYAACQRDVAGGLAVLAINLDTERSAAVLIEGVTGASAEIDVATAPDRLGKTVLVNGRPLAADASGAPPAIVPERARVRPGLPLVTLPPTSYAFVALPDSGAPGCG
ncbi:MAG: hypothetical protein U0610_32900 [bacterium]